MNVLTRHCFLVVLSALLLDTIETGDAYKLIRPYKYYQRRPWQRPRWHTGHKSSKFYHSKRIPPEDYYSRGPSHYRPGSVRDDFDGPVENHPYTIVIQLPKEEDKYGEENHIKRKRKYERASIPVYTDDSEYLEDEDDSESRVVNVNDKKVQIKMIKGENPKLHIKISRSDDDTNVQLVDKSNITASDLLQLSSMHENITDPKLQSTEKLTSIPHLENQG